MGRMNEEGTVLVCIPARCSQRRKFFDILEENKKREKEKATEAFPREREAESSRTVAKGPYGKESRQGHTGDA